MKAVSTISIIKICNIYKCSGKVDAIHTLSDTTRQWLRVGWREQCGGGGGKVKEGSETGASLTIANNSLGMGWLGAPADHLSSGQS